MQAQPKLRAGDVAIAQQPFPDERDHFIGSRCLPQAALSIGGIFMRVTDKSAPRRGVRPARQRTIATTNALPALLSRRSRRLGLGANSVTAVVAGILGAAGLAVTGNAHAQAAATPATLPPPPTSAQTSQNLETVVVTATATAVRKIDASYNVVSADRDLIKQANPLSSADILKIAPGIWPEA
ncbi:MAG TPA: hypothetical protein VGG96_08145, partial [Steroidobacteraceae bacterium]